MREEDNYNRKFEYKEKELGFHVDLLPKIAARKSERNPERERKLRHFLFCFVFVELKMFLLFDQIASFLDDGGIRIGLSIKINKQ